LERNGKGRFVNLDALDNIINAKLLMKQEDTTSTDFGKHKRAILIYNEEALRRVFLLRQWLSVFREEIRF
jgi:hypothetical protein